MTIKGSTNNDEAIARAIQEQQNEPGRSHNVMIDPNVADVPSSDSEEDEVLARSLQKLEQEEADDALARRLQTAEQRGQGRRQVATPMGTSDGATAIIATATTQDIEQPSRLTTLRSMPRSKPAATRQAARSDQATDNDDAKCCVVFFVVFVVTGLIVLLAAVGGSGGEGGYGGGGYGGSGFRGGSSRGGGGSACFPAGEQVLLASSTSGDKAMEQIHIEQLEPGTMIHGGGRVMAVMKLQADPEEDPLYRYNNSVFVTGWHLVKEDEGSRQSQEDAFSWKPVRESKYSRLVQEQELEDANLDPQPFVYNLITTKHRIVINSTVFADWDPEEPDVYGHSWEVERQVLNRLNNDHTSREQQAAGFTDGVVGEGAFHPDTLIRLSNGTSIPIEHVQPGMELHSHDDESNRNVVFSVMKLWIPEDTIAYHYKGMTVSEWTLVRDDDGVWRHVRDSSSAQPRTMGVVDGSAANVQQTHSTTSVWYQLWTTTHQVPSIYPEIVFADYHIFDDDDPMFASAGIAYEL